MTGKAFVDTNVFVYAYDSADRKKQDAALRFLASNGPESLVLSSQVLSEFFVVTTRRLAVPMSEVDAADAVRSLSALQCVALTGALVVRAIDVRSRWQTSYWDALIVAAAESAGCTRIISEDLATGATVAGMAIESPFG